MTGNSIRLLWVLPLLMLASCVAGRIGPAPAVEVVEIPPQEAVAPGQTVVVVEGDADVVVSFVTERFPSLFREWETVEMCTSPCQVRIPDQSYAMLVGGTYLNDQFEIDARGGIQRWEVEDENWWLLLGGSLLTTGGVTLTMLIGLPQLGAYAFHEVGMSDFPTDPGYAVFGVLGLAALVGGIWMMAEWPPDAELIGTE